MDPVPLAIADNFLGENSGLSLSVLSRQIVSSERVNHQFDSEAVQRYISENATGEDVSQRALDREVAGFRDMNAEAAQNLVTELKRDCKDGQATVKLIGAATTLSLKATQSTLKLSSNLHDLHVATTNNVNQNINRLMQLRIFVDQRSTASSPRRSASRSPRC